MDSKKYIESEYGVEHLKSVMKLNDETSLYALMDEYAGWKSKKCNIPDVMLLCPFCESTNTTVIEAVSDCVCDDCGKDFEA